MDDTFKFDVNTVMYVLYLFYKENLLTRKHLKDMFKIVKGELPKDVIKYLVEEGEKAA
jgi:Ca2+-binding EF-hand superfamily protein